MSHRDRITALLTSGGPQPRPKGNLTPEEQAIISGMAAPTEEERWGREFRNQVPMSLTPGVGVIHPQPPNFGPDYTERMPQVVGNGVQVVEMPNYGQEVPPRAMGSVEYPTTPEPAFEGQLSGEVPTTW